MTLDTKLETKLNTDSIVLLAVAICVAGALIIMFSRLTKPKQ
jgi:hypothetical protein